MIRHKQLTIKYKKLFGITAALLGVAVTYYFGLNQLNDHEVQPNQPGFSKTETGEADEPVDTPTIKFDQVIKQKEEVNDLSPRNLVRNFESAISAEAAQSVILDIYNAGEIELAEQLETELHSRCQEPNNTGYRSQFERTEWVYDKIEEYCSSYTPLMTQQEYESRLAQKSARKAYKSSELVKKYLDSDSKNADIDFADHIAGASDETDISAGLSALEMLHNMGLAPSLGQDNNQFASPAQELKLKRTALRMYECYLFGGCGPDGMTTQLACGLTGQCDPGWSMYDFYRYTLSAAEYEQVELMLNYLYGLQSGG